jgi:hypothetical protein
MMSLETMQALSREAGIEAAENAITPKFFRDSDIESLKAGNLSGLKAIPNLGDHTPEGFELVESHFVDSSGFGAEDEPALTFGQFIGKLNTKNGYAITEVGQFQIYIGEFKKTALGITDPLGGASILS